MIPQVLDAGLVQISGDVGRGIRLGQFLNGNGFSEYEHVFTYLGEGEILEAEPGGARIRSLAEYASQKVFWCSPLLAEAQRLKGAGLARRYVGTPYSFLDYGALAARRLHVPAPGLRDYIGDTGHMICSQLADQVWQDAGHVEWPDEWCGYVTPGMFWERFR